MDLSSSEYDELNVVVKTDYFTVIDGLLTEEQRDRLWNYFQMQPFQRVEALERAGHLPGEESKVLRGPTIGWGRAFDGQYPTETAVDDVIRALIDNEDLIAPLIGPRGTDWTVLSATPTIHVAGQGEAWHRDPDDRAGGWVYFAHRRWNIEWGGELLVAHEKDIPADRGPYFHRLRPTFDAGQTVAWRSHLDNQDANELLLEQGIGSYIVPKPNRLVIIKRGTPLAIAKMRPSAGHNVRVTLGGSFIRPDAGSSA